MANLPAHRLFPMIFSAGELRRIAEDIVLSTRAVGRDGVKVHQFHKILDDEIKLIVKKTQRNTYKFTRYKEKLILKGHDRPPRLVSIPTVRDRLTLRALCELLSQVYKDDDLLRKPHWYVKNIIGELCRIDAEYSFVRIDVINYYPSIDREILLKKIRKRIRKEQILLLLQQAICTPTINGIPNDYGIPQGLSISNLLASLYLYDVDRTLSSRWTYFRYVDDILMICKKEEADKAFNEVKKKLSALNLKCHEPGNSGKTEISSVEKGVDYLGYTFRLRYVGIRKSSYRKMFERIVGVVTDFRHKKREARLVWVLNLKITGCVFEGKRYGWMFFFSQTEDMRQLARLDNFVKQQLHRVGAGGIHKHVKSFVKTHREIRFNRHHSTYIPNFDEFSFDDMAETVKTLGNRTIEDIQRMPREDVERTFFALVRRQTVELERDLFGVNQSG